MESPIGLILEMLSLVIRNTLSTLISIFELLRELVHSLGFVGDFGALPFIISVIILGGVLFFAGKFFISSLKTIIMLFLAGFLILLAVFAFV